MPFGIRFSIDAAPKCRFNSAIYLKAAGAIMEHGNIKTSLYILGYTLLGWLFFFTVFPFICVFSCLTGKHRRSLPERLGFYRSAPQQGKPRIWLHAASVGEAQAAHKLLAAFREKLPEAAYFITAVTEQGKEVARTLAGDAAQVFLAPLDLPFSVSNAINSIRPDIYICLETELWPQLLFRLHRSGAQLFLTNGRISSRSFSRYRLLGSFMQRLLGLFREISVIGQNDAERFIALGADRQHLHVTGNIKIDPGAQRSETELTALRNSLGLAGKDKVFICGSTRSGEEELLLPVYRQLKSTLPDLVWFIAPRHLQRLAEVETLLRGNGLSWQRFSMCRSSGRTEEIVIVDTLGELQLLYGLGTYIFCGGSLVAKGGHNIMEPVAWGRPVFYGPFMNDFEDAKQLLEEHGVGFQVASSRELLDRIIEFDRQPERYGEIHRKALDLARLQHNVALRQTDIVIRNCCNNAAPMP